MKKLLAILVLGLVLSGNAYSAVFYCVDDLVTGMEGEYKTSQTYINEKFNMKVDDENKKLIIDKDTYNQIGNESLGIFATDFGFTIRIFKSGDKIGYHRSSVFGMTDGIFIANGFCENF